VVFEDGRFGKTSDKSGFRRPIQKSIYYPKKFENTYRHWLENIRDWNVSRQLWWGQQIPAFYYGDHKEDYVVAENKDKALVIARKKSGNSNLGLEDLRQDNDALRYLVFFLALANIRF